jgi:hypothetical protein
MGRVERDLRGLTRREIEAIHIHCSRAGFCHVIDDPPVIRCQRQAIEQPGRAGVPTRVPDRSTHSSRVWPTAPPKKTSVPELDTENSA